MSSLGQLDRRRSFGAVLDRQLLSDVQKGDKVAIEQLIEKYENIVYKKANHYFLVGSDRDDVVQEGLIGLYKAICDYDESKRASFRSFAELCITRQIISSIKAATRMKHTPLNAYVSFDKPLNDEESDRTILETIVHEGTIEPLVWMEKKEQMMQTRTHLMRALTILEWDVLCYYVEGWSYEEMSQKIGRHEKSIDNALQRIKRKVGQLIQENDFFHIK